MGKFLMTFVYRHPWVTAFLLWGIADTAIEVQKTKNSKDCSGEIAEKAD